METKIFKPTEVGAAADLIRQGELVAFPTETVYGLGADATNVAAVEKVYKAKGRPSDNPLIVHVADQATVRQFVTTIQPAVQRLMDTFWPGPLTIILPLQPGSLAPQVTGGLTTAAFRNPRQAATLDLIKTAGVPLVGPSANTSGKPSPTTAQHVYHDLKGKIGGILDAGPTDLGVESTVIDMSTAQPAILRPGAVTRADLERVLGPIADSQKQVKPDEVPKAPGMKYTHYSPTAEVQIVDPEVDWETVVTWSQQQPAPVGILATDAVLNRYAWPQNVATYSLGTDIHSASHALFAGLRAFDLHPDITTILVEGFSPNGLGEAYMNRLNKAAGQHHFSTADLR
ncbi:L-threonylcarbamoyladenylate synthase [Fructilactobacillus myrtifloralis]|uniref:Threonylcarbamoyl-AMP synthase n=1 Tax=Fructilactobacillus myrtifloralis TaxID=2940301 RepID=A0ABY5BPZ6_9LACO|nr:L-threonylcarbamoyladenylate synthase [Fructilactobacillus myrtifloralis]USS85133.1 L-threonylcarbamoyladenylate synthase [Fructilactobacillus myrtifloralis]